MSKIKILMFSLLIIFLLFVLYLIINPIFFGLWKLNLNIWSSESNLKNYVKYITSFENQRSHKNIKSLNLVADYIYDNFENNKCDKVFLQAYKIDWKEYKNVICRFNWKVPEKIIIWAHYDTHQEYINNNFSEISNFAWADDNASWVAWLLELTRLAWKNKRKLNNSIEFVAYTLEEQPYFGTRNMWSFIHAKSLKDEWASIKYMLSLEMIWFFSDEKIQNYPMKIFNLIYPSKWNFIAIIWALFDFNISEIKKKMIINSNIDVWSLSSPVFIKWADYSDHRNYWLFWYKAYMITDTGAYRNKNYHTALDVFNTLDFQKMNEVVKWVYWLLVK